MIVEKFVPELESPGCIKSQISISLVPIVLPCFGNLPIQSSMELQGPQVSRSKLIRLWLKCARLNFDYGKFDYVMFGGRAVLLDCNKTIGGGAIIRSCNR